MHVKVVLPGAGVGVGSGVNTTAGVPICRAAGAYLLGRPGGICLLGLQYHCNMYGLPMASSGLRLTCRSLCVVLGWIQYRALKAISAYTPFVNL